MNTNTSIEFYTVNDVADLLRLSTKQVRRMIDRGELVNRLDLARYLDEHYSAKERN